MPSEVNCFLSQLIKWQGWDLNLSLPDIRVLHSEFTCHLRIIHGHVFSTVL